MQTMRMTYDIQKLFWPKKYLSQENSYMWKDPRTLFCSCTKVKYLSIIVYSKTCKKIELIANT